MAPGPQIIGIVNVTEDSFSDGGLYLEPSRAAERARQLVGDGAFAVDLGPASSHPDAQPVAPDEEIRRLEPVLAPLLEAGIRICVDSFQPETQLWALARGVHYLNDIEGFRRPEIYGELARSDCGLIVMHSVQRRGAATRVRTDPETVIESALEFFAERLAALEAAGVARERVVLDPGMGFFLGADPEPSLAALRSLRRIRALFDLPVLVCVSRKSFLGALTGRPIAERLPATLAAELYAARHGADYIRTHDVRALKDALRVTCTLEAP
jgi:dihydropteroate synthase type 2